MDSSHLLAALVCGVACAALGWFVPTLIGRVPEPVPDPDELVEQPTGDDDRRLFSSDLPAAPPKELYADIADSPALRLWCVLAGAVAGVGVGAAVGWSGALVYLVPFVPFGTALFVIDWRTTLLPSWLVKPAYPVLLVLLLVAWAVDRDLSDLERAGWGWLVIGGWFLVLWLITGGGGFGYGDIRLAGLIGPALGYLGWAEMLVGLMLIFLCGVVGAIAVALSRGSMKVRVPYGPFMLLGAWLGVLVGPWLAAAAGY